MAIYPLANKAETANAVYQSIQGSLLSCQNVAPNSVINALTLQGVTTEVGTGSKSINNPYAIKGAGEGGSIGLAVTGKNLFSLANAVFEVMAASGSFSKSANYVEFIGSAGSYGIQVRNFPVKPNTDYTLNSLTTVVSGTSSYPAGGMRVRMVGTNTYTAISTGQPVSFNTGANTLIDVIFYVGVPDTNACTVRWSNIQLELGSVASSYEPFGTSLSLPIATPLYSLPDGTADTYDPITGVVTRVIKKLTLQASDIYAISPQTNVDYVYVKKPTDYIYYNVYNGDSGAFIFNNCPIAIGGYNGVSNIGSVGSAGSQPYFIVITAKGAYTDTATAATALTGTVILYKLATPTTEQLTPVARPSMISPVTNVFGTDAYAPYLVAKYVVDSNYLITSKADKTQEAWITPTLLNGWEAFDTSRTPKYMKDSMGFVHVRGLVKTGAIGTTVFTLPIGYRPYDSVSFATKSSGNTFGALDVNQAGAVIVSAGSSTYVYLDAIIFKAEN